MNLDCSLLKIVGVDTTLGNFTLGVANTTQGRPCDLPGDVLSEVFSLAVTSLDEAPALALVCTHWLRIIGHAKRVPMESLRRGFTDADAAAGWPGP